MEITEDELEELKEHSWVRGQRSVLTRQLTDALNGLGYGAGFTKERLIKEREELISTLRTICDEFGDNNWDENLNLSDVINKHLRNYL